MSDTIPIEEHPWEPFIPDGAKVLILGTFPPPPKRWAMNFYYPNRTNDFWKIMGLVFYSDPFALYSAETKEYNMPGITGLLTEKGIALSDTGRKVRRLKGNASDKFLEILEPVPLFELLSQMPLCHSIVTTGEKATGIVAGITDTVIPRMGEMVKSASGLEIWRMPSTSRAYPLAIEKKADYYSDMFRHIGII